MLKAVLRNKVNMDMEKKPATRRNSNKEKMLPPRNSPRVPPMELRRSKKVEGSTLVTSTSRVLKNNSMKRASSLVLFWGREGHNFQARL